MIIRRNWLFSNVIFFALRRITVKQRCISSKINDVIRSIWIIGKVLFDTNARCHMAKWLPAKKKCEPLKTPENPFSQLSKKRHAPFIVDLSSWQLEMTMCNLSLILSRISCVFSAPNSSTFISLIHLMRSPEMKGNYLSLKEPCLSVPVAYRIYDLYRNLG